LFCDGNITVTYIFLDEKLFYLCFVWDCALHQIVLQKDEKTEKDKMGGTCRQMEVMGNVSMKGRDQSEDGRKEIKWILGKSGWRM
jgi:hypothetical protein